MDRQLMWLKQHKWQFIAVLILVLIVAGYFVYELNSQTIQPNHPQNTSIYK